MDHPGRLDFLGAKDGIETGLTETEEVIPWQSGQRKGMRSRKEVQAGRRKGAVVLSTVVVSGIEHD